MDTCRRIGRSLELTQVPPRRIQQEGETLSWMNVGIFVGRLLQNRAKLWVSPQLLTMP
jgi:hypothetical protein